MANDSGILAYAEIAEGIGLRILHAEQSLARWRESEGYPFHLEEAALQVRMICEAILLASFMLHSEVVDDLLSALKKNDRWDKLKKILEKENPDYMPRPISSVRTDPKTIQISPLEDIFISGSELFKMWGKSSELLHCRNPLQAQLSKQMKAEELASNLKKFKDVMLQHAIAIPSDGVLYLVNVDIVGEKPKVHWWIASQLPKGSVLQA